MVLRYATWIETLNQEGQSRVGCCKFLGLACVRSLLDASGGSPIGRNARHQDNAKCAPAVGSNRQYACSNRTDSCRTALAWAEFLPRTAHDFRHRNVPAVRNAGNVVLGRGRSRESSLSKTNCGGLRADFIVR